MKFYKPIFLLSFLFVSLWANTQTQVIAHRGYWQKEGSAQNSISSLQNACKIEAYGSEVDIRLTADNIAVVNHDADIDIDGEKLIIEDHNFSVIRQAKLSNGETISTFEEYLSAFETCQNMKLIVEFKSHKSSEKDRLLTEQVVKMVKNKGLSERVEYIAFGINYIYHVRELAPESDVYYLNGDWSPQQLKEIGAAGLDYHYSIFQKHPKWIEEAHQLGLKTNAWTVNSEEMIIKLLGMRIDFITTDRPELAQSLIREQQDSKCNF